MTINGDRIKQAREISCFTQKQLADVSRVKQATIAQFESGRAQPSEEVLQRIAFQTGFPIPFFRRPAAADFPLGTLMFRAKAKMRASERNQARQLARTVYEEYQYLRAFTRRRPLTLPRLTESPSEAARITRSSLGLSPDNPIDNLIRAIERAGVIVLALPTGLPNRDAFSAWVTGDDLEPIIVLAGTVAGDRLRWSVAHELGHLVLHHSIRASTKEIEREADLFASDLLMPAESMRREMLRPITISSLSRLKPRWKVSIQSLIRRAFNLDFITDRQYRYLNQQINWKGWKFNEPLPVEPEKPRAFRQMAEMIYGNPQCHRQLAAAVCHPASFVRATLEAHDGRFPLARDAVPARPVARISDYFARRPRVTSDEMPTEP